MSLLEVELDVFGLVFGWRRLESTVSEPVDTKTITNVLWTEDPELMEHCMLEATRSFGMDRWTFLPAGRSLFRLATSQKTTTSRSSRKRLDTHTSTPQY